MKDRISVTEYTHTYHERVTRHILDIQNNDLSVDLSLADQPDLVSIESSYQESGGNFWIAIDKDDQVIGTIALFNLGQQVGDLRKMFLKKEYRGSPPGISRLLFETLVDWAKENKYKKIFLETNTTFRAAIKFYLKNGFTQIDKTELPENFPVIKVAELFFMRDLNAIQE